MLIILCIIFMIGLWLFYEGCTNNNITSEPSTWMGIVGFLLMVFSIIFLARYIFLDLQHI